MSPGTRRIGLTFARFLGSRGGGSFLARDDFKDFAGSSSDDLERPSVRDDGECAPRDCFSGVSSAVSESSLDDWTCLHAGERP